MSILLGSTACWSNPFFSDLLDATQESQNNSTSLLLLAWLAPNPSETLHVTASASQVLMAEQATFQATNGTAPYSFRIQSGAGSIDANGIYTAGAVLGSQTILVTDANSLSGTATISVFGGQGNGTFQNTDGSVNYNSPTQPERINAGDFNQDGAIDIAIGTNGGATQYVYIFQGNGDGTFSGGITNTLSSSARGIEIIDVNGDSKLDVITGEQDGTDHFAVLIGNGDLTLQGRTDYAAPASIQDLVTADFDNDGKVDLVSCGTDDSLSFHKGTGDGTFSAYVSTGAINNPFHVSAADLNLDGNMDAITSNYSGAPSTNAGVSVFLGNGDGTFQNPVEYATNTNSHSVKVADFNNDGILDLVSANRGAASISTLLGNGDGTFQTAVDTAVGASPFDMAPCDLNGDGRMDLAVASEGASQVSILFGNNDGTFAAQTPFSAPGGPKEIICRDLNNDQKMDIATPTVNSHRFRVYLGN